MKDWEGMREVRRGEGVRKVRTCLESLVCRPGRREGWRDDRDTKDRVERSVRLGQG